MGYGRICQERVIGEELLQEINHFTFNTQERLFAILYSANRALVRGREQMLVEFYRSRGLAASENKILPLSPKRAMPYIARALSVFGPIPEDGVQAFAQIATLRFFVVYYGRGELFTRCSLCPLAYLPVCARL